LLWLAVPVMVGIAWAAIVPWPSGGVALAVAYAAATLGFVVAHHPPSQWSACICVAMFGVGIATLRMHDRHQTDWDDLPPREADVSIRLDRVFPRQDAMATGIGTLVSAEGAAADLVAQRLYFSIRLRRGEERPVRSAVIRCRGVLAPVPKRPPAASFERYLADAGIHVRLSRGRVVETVRPAQRYYVVLERAAVQIGRWLDEGVAARHPALAAVFRAMMLGQKHELSSEQNELFMHSGTMHLFAINGLHIGVVAVAVHALQAIARCPRRVAVPIVLAVLWFDVDTTGASPSAVRAFLLVACVEAGFFLRRPPNGLASLSAAAVLALLWDPFALFSASFQMSYGVVLAILTFGLPLAESLERRLTPFQLLPQVTWNWRHKMVVAISRKVWAALGIGAAAGVVSAITGPTFFQVFAPIGLVSNLILVPLAMGVIIAGFGSIIAALASLGGINVLLNHAAMVLLTIIDYGVRASAHLPTAWWAASWRCEWFGSMALAAVLTTMVFGYSNGWRIERGGWWPPIALTVVAVAAGVRFG
jgi:competence protein ComEC